MKKIWMHIVALLFIIVTSNNTKATQDAETPEQKLEMIRLLLSNGLVANEVATIAVKGCVWVNEVVWFGKGEIVSEGGYTAGGGFTIYYKSKSNKKRQLDFDWQGLRSIEGYTVTDVQLSKTIASDLDCT